MAATLPSDAKQHEAQQAADQAPAPEPAPAKRTARRQWSIQGKALCPPKKVSNYSNLRYHLDCAVTSGEDILNDVMYVANVIIR